MLSSLATLLVEELGKCRRKMQLFGLRVNGGKAGSGWAMARNLMNFFHDAYVIKRTIAQQYYQFSFYVSGFKTLFAKNSKNLGLLLLLTAAYQCVIKNVASWNH